MRIKQASFVLSLVSAPLLAPGLGGAVEMGGVDLGIQPRFEAGAMYYKFEQGAVSVTTPSTFNFTQTQLSYKDTLFFFGGGATVFADRFFVDLSAYKAIDGEASDTLDTSTFVSDPELTAFATFSPVVKTDFDREEYAVSLGYNITDQFSVFGGYKWATTDFESKVSGPATFDFFEPDPLKGVTGTYSGRLDTRFKYDGPFIGGAYGFNIDRASLRGGLLFNLAVAFLDGEVQERTNETGISDIRFQGVPVPEGSIPLPGRLTTSFASKGDTVGITLGITWRGLTPIKNLTYSLGINGYKYDFNADNELQPDISETVVYFRGGIAYAF